MTLPSRRPKESRRYYCRSWVDCVVPVAVEAVALDVDALHLRGGDLDAFLVGGLVELGIDLQAGVGARGGDQVDDRGVVGQRAAAPVDRDEAEQAVLDAVPLAGARREV